MATKRTTQIVFLLVLVCLAGRAVCAEETPLSKDDVTLLLIGGANTEKMVELVGRRGVDFQMSPDLAKRFHDLGASDEVIEALQRASKKTARSTERSTASSPAQPPEAGTGASPSSPPISSGHTPQPAGNLPASSSVQQRVKETLAEKDAPLSDDASASSRGPGAAGARPAGPRTPAKPAATVDLKDPSPEEIQRIIQEFATKEKMFKHARDNYAFHQINKVDELGPNDQVVGTYRQDWDILFDDAGKRIEQVTYAPLPTLKGLMVTKEDLDAMRSIQPFVLTVDELPDYEIKYLGHVRVDELTTYVFSVRPKEIQKGRLYFKGVVWVDDRDLQIVKTEGKSVPETKTKSGENLFPRFITYREQIDGKYWFPTFTMADDTLYFPTGAIHIKEVIRYTDYKQFKSKVRILSSTPTDETGATPTEAPSKKQP